MKKKIAICGPTKLNSEEADIANRIGDAMSSMVSPEEVIFASGGTTGFPTEVLLGIKKQGRPYACKAYTPCKDTKEWADFYQKGIASPLELYTEVIYSVGEDSFKTRALQRIPLLVSGSDVVLAYLNDKARNTYIEVLSSAALGIPTLVLSQTSIIRDSASNLTGTSKGIEIFLDQNELIRKLSEQILS